MSKAITNYNLRLEKDLRDRAFKVIEDYGFTPSQALKMFLHQIADLKAIPLVPFNYKSEEPNEITQEAIRELREGRAERITVNSIEEFNSLMEKMANEQL